MEVADDGGSVLERLRALQSLYPPNCTVRRVFIALSCVALISRAWMLCSCVTSPLRSARRKMFCPRIIHSFSVFNFRTSELHGRLSLCAPLRILHQVLRTFLQYQSMYLLSCALTLLDSCTVCPSHRNQSIH